jgi:glycine betaine/proline transport system substrate-binding protein
VSPLRSGVQHLALAVGVAALTVACGSGGGAAEGGVGAADAGERRITMARADWDTGFMQAAIYQQLLTRLGYAVNDPATETRNAATFYPALARGDIDLWANGWFPLHDIYLKREQFTGQTVEEPIEPVGVEVAAGALQGYLVDKASADRLGITSMTDFEDPAIAAEFDNDGDGKADLVGCNDGWGCNVAITEQIGTFDWGANVEQVVGDYGSLFRDVEARITGGRPALFYTWTPNWTLAELVPGQDVVWLQAPSADDETNTSVAGLGGCAGGADPCELGWEVNDIRAVGNVDFLDDHPDVRRLLEQVTIPLEDIAAQNVKMASRGDYTNADVQADAADWIATNQQLVDKWLSAARG